MSKLHKLTNAFSDDFVYVDLTDSKVITPWRYHCTKAGRDREGTSIHFKGSAASPQDEGLVVKEHILEVIAMYEGRDSKPAKILYGDKK